MSEAQKPLPPHLVSAQDWITATIKGLIDDPDNMSITLREVGDRSAEFLITVPPNELGKIVGKQGKTAKAFRTMLHARSAKDHMHYQLNVCTQ